MKKHVLIACALFWAPGAFAADGDDMLENASRFINQLPPEQREALFNKAKDAISKMQKRREKKAAENRKSASKMSLNLVKELFKKGETAFEEGDFPIAYAYFEVVASSQVTGAEQLRNQARERLTEIEAEAIARYDGADVKFRQGDYVPSALLLNEILDLFPYTSVADRARNMLRRLTARPDAAAAVMYAKGKRHEDAEDYVKAVEIYAEVVEQYPTQLDGMRAKIRLDKLRSDPEVIEILRRAREFEAYAEAPKLLNLGRNYLLNDQYDRAREKLDEIVRRFPDSPEATEARELLEAMVGD